MEGVMWVRTRCWARVLWVGVGESGLINSGSGIIRGLLQYLPGAGIGDGWLCWRLWLGRKGRDAS